MWVPRRSYVSIDFIFLINLFIFDFAGSLQLHEVFL